MSLSTRPQLARLSFLVATTFLVYAGRGVAQEEGQVPGAIPDPSTYQGSLEQQRQSDEQDQQFRAQAQQQQQNQEQLYQQQQSQSYRPAIVGRQVGNAQSSTGATRLVDLSHDTPAAAIRRGDYATALRLARPKALAGDAASEHTLAYLYESGSGVPLDYAVAASWNRKAAEQGDAQGQADLGWMYFNGLGVQRDPVQAYKWLVLAGRQDATARRHMQEVAAAITYDQMSEGLSLAQQWTPNVASTAASTKPAGQHKPNTR